MMVRWCITSASRMTYSDEAGDLVAHALGRHDSDLIAYLKFYNHNLSYY